MMHRVHLATEFGTSRAKIKQFVMSGSQAVANRRYADDLDRYATRVKMPLRKNRGCVQVVRYSLEAGIGIEPIYMDLQSSA
ncbi:MAG: hypothetical protein JWS11_3260 [Cypionkella sp.]|nr:hypothetical protein [Cypionkella sp.]